MLQWPLGVFVSTDAGRGVDLDMVGQLGVPTIHLHAPRRGSRTAAQSHRLRERLAEMGVEVTCVFAGFPGESYHDIPTVKETVGLVPPATRRQRWDELLEIAAFADKLGVASVGLHLGFIPHDPSSSEYRDLCQLTRAACDRLSDRGQALHLETGQETADALVDFLTEVDRGNLFVNFDPANMILYGAGQPLPALRTLGPWVRGVHCKDASPSARPGVEWGTETPLGEGAVDMPAFLQTLADVDYRGPLTIEREISHDPPRQKAEVAAALALLAKLQSEMRLA